MPTVTIVDSVFDGSLRKPSQSFPASSMQSFNSKRPTIIPHAVHVLYTEKQRKNKSYINAEDCCQFRVIAD